MSKDSNGEESETPPVPIDTITTAPEEVPGSGDASGLKEAQQLAHEAEKFQKELGWLGKPFGGKTEKPGNISALVIICSFAFLAVAYFYPSEGLSFERIFSGITSIVTLILGYLFGSTDSSGPDK